MTRPRPCPCRCPDPIEARVAELRDVLHGPPRHVRDLLAEVRDGLHDAASAHRAAGLAPHIAAAARRRRPWWRWPGCRTS